MYILGIDFGTKKLGLAVLETSSRICSPLPLIKNDKELWNNLARVLQEYRVFNIVLGLPSYADTAKKVEKFKQELQKRFTLQIDYTPEDLTSMTVKKELISKKQKQNLDSFSAVAILEQWVSDKEIN